MTEALPPVTHISSFPLVSPLEVATLLSAFMSLTFVASTCTGDYARTGILNRLIDRGMGCVHFIADCLRKSGTLSARDLGRKISQ